MFFVDYRMATAAALLLAGIGHAHDDGKNIIVGTALVLYGVRFCCFIQRGVHVWLLIPY